MVVDVAVAELDRLHERIAGRFGRSEPRARVREYVSGLRARPLLPDRSGLDGRQPLAHRGMLPASQNEAGLDHYQVRSWRAWYAHITLSMLALAWLAASKAQAVKGEPAPATQA